MKKNAALGSSLDKKDMNLFVGGMLFKSNFG